MKETRGLLTLNVPVPGTKPSSLAPVAEQADHVLEAQVGGRRRRSKRLRVVSPLQLPADWELLAGVPRTRADCANVPRPCPYISCKHHLWLRLQEEQPGNPQKGRQGPTTFRPSTMQSCALDVAEKGASYEEIGDHLGMDSTRARQIAVGAVEKIKEENPELAAQLFEALQL